MKSFFNFFIFQTNTASSKNKQRFGIKMSNSYFEQTEIKYPQIFIALLII